VRKSSLILWCRGRKRAMLKSRGKWVHWGGRSCLVGSRPWKNSYVALTPLETTWWCSVTLLWSVSYDNNLKLLKILNFWSIFLLLITSLSTMITLCYNIKLCLMWLVLIKTMLSYIALEFWIQLYHILGNVLPRCWRCDITLITSPLSSWCLPGYSSVRLAFP
jgi:hypothetical protein